MATNASEAMTLKYLSSGTGSPATAIGQLVSFSGPSMTAEMVRTDAMGAGWITKRASKKLDAGKFTFSVMYDKTDTSHDDMVSAFGSGTAQTFSVFDSAASPAALITFSGPVLKWDFKEASNDSKQYVAECEVDISGQPTLA